MRRGSRFKFANIRISTKLLVINTLICSVFVLISLAIFWTCYHAQGLIKAVIAHDISEVTNNALTERELFSIQADTALLLNTFFEKDEYLKTEGNRLFHLTQVLVERNKNRDLEQSLRGFAQNLAFLLEQCAAVNDELRLLNVSEQKIMSLMDKLEQVIAQKLIELTSTGEDTGIMEQLATLAASYHTSLLEIGKMRAESWPAHYYADIDPADDTVLAALDGLILRCRTLAASDLVVAQVGQRLIHALQDFRTNNQTLHSVMSELNTQIKRLGNAQQQIETTIAALDRDVAHAIRLVDTKIDRRFRVTGITSLLLTASLVVALGLFTTFFFKKIIKNPIERIREGIEGLQSGNLETRIQLGRNDEWSIIERALNSMAQELSGSYSMLQFKEHIIESAASAIATVGLDGKMTYINPSFLKTWGFDDPAEILGRSFREFWIVGGRSDEINTALWGSGSWQEEIQARRKDGLIFDTQVSGSMVFDAQGNPLGVMVTSIDITERKHAETELYRLRNLLRNIVDSMPSILVAVDNDGRVTQWNREVEKVTGVTSQDAQGSTLVDLFPQLAGELEKIQQAIRERKPLKETKVAMDINDQKRFSDITVYPLETNGVEGMVIRVDDVTERVRIEEMMIQSEKMLSVGGLAAGMAHEINNPLAAIMQNAQVVLNRISKDLSANQKVAAECGTNMEAVNNYIQKRNILKMLEAVRASGVRAAKIVENILSFSRKSRYEYLPHTLSTLLDNTIALASSDYDLKKKFDFRQIEIRREYDPDLPQLRCEGTEIQQVVLNLLKNAAEAIAARKEKIAPPWIALRTSKEGDMVRIEVEDNGPGMDEDVRRRVFEPFFTTKAIGAGTGLGMSVSYFIITENHHGTMEVESTPGRGSKFIIRLPLKA